MRNILKTLTNAGFDLLRPFAVDSEKQRLTILNLLHRDEYIAYNCPSVLPLIIPPKPSDNLYTVAIISLQSSRKLQQKRCNARPLNRPLSVAPALMALNTKIWTYRLHYKFKSDTFVFELTHIRVFTFWIENERCTSGEDTNEWASASTEIGGGGLDGNGAKGRLTNKAIGHVIACAQISVTCCRAGLDGPGTKGGVWFSQLPVAWLLLSL